MVEINKYLIFLKKTFVCIAILWSSISGAHAHPMPNSTMDLYIGDSTIRGEVTIPSDDLESVFKTLHMEISDENIKNYFLKHIHTLSSKNTWDIAVGSILQDISNDALIGDYKTITIEFLLTPPNPETLRDFDLYYDAIMHQIITHSTIVSLKADWKTGHFGESREQIGIIAANADGVIHPLTISLQSGNMWTGWSKMFLYGMEHIRAGTDHVMFLLSLLLIAPLTIQNKKWSLFEGKSYTVKRFLGISLAFTVGHSFSLIFGSLNVISANTSLIEILIAVSILLSGINVIVPIFCGKEKSVAFGFGLIHGLAFSFSLRSLDMNPFLKILSIFGFNLGIEAMQIIIMLLFVPIIFLSHSPLYHSIRNVFGVIIIFFALFWIGERAFGIGDIITYYVGK